MSVPGRSQTLIPQRAARRARLCCSALHGRRQLARRPGPPPARGAATLVVVMVLFFIVAMVAAYTSRNLIFEQKTSANQYRSTIALEAAEAGAEWALAMLNGGGIDNNCQPQAGSPSFQQRYLSPGQATGLANGIFDVPPARLTTPPPAPPTRPTYWPAPDVTNMPRCYHDGTTWAAACSCPAGTALTTLTLPVDTSQARPGFSVWLPMPQPTPPTERAGLVQVQVNGCTRMPAGAGGCVDFEPAGAAGEAVASVRIVAALRPGIASTPAAALTAQGNLVVTPAGAQVRVVNTAAEVNGLTAHVGGTLPAAGLLPRGLPGVPGEATWVAGDTQLATLATQPPGADTVRDSRMFIAQFGMKLPVYRDQPGLRRCPGFDSGPCDAAGLAALLARHPNRILWVDGDVTLDSTLGSAAAPVLLVVNNGRLTLGSGVQVTGLVYLVGTDGGANAPLLADLDAPTIGSASIVGALVAGGTLRITHPGGAPAPGQGLSVVYDSAVLNLLRTTYGSWVRLPGGWRDFRD